MTLNVAIAIICVLNAALLAWLLKRTNASASIDGIREEFRANREEQRRTARELREEVGINATRAAESLSLAIASFSSGTARSAADAQTALDAKHDLLRRLVDEKLQATIDNGNATARSMNDQLTRTLSSQNQVSLQQLKSVSDLTQSRLDAVRVTVETELRQLQATNAKCLDDIRKTVDEQLQITLERRLGESFKIVSGHLESVQRGLGEMQALATGVGDLKRVLTNVKARGTWAEVQLGVILEETLTSDQFSRNVQTNDHSSERVEFAVRLPGRSGDPSSCVWLPIDSKFPQEAYVRLTHAADAADADLLKNSIDELERAVKLQAKDISAKYINPPKTTDFAIMFVPTEGLYAEILRMPALVSDLQNKHRVMVAGPTSLTGLLSSLRLGFQTLAIEKRASEVWQVLRAVKTEFSKFGGVLGKLRRQLEQATRTIDNTDARARAMQRRLGGIDALPIDDATALLELAETDDALDAPLDPSLGSDDESR